MTYLLCKYSKRNERCCFCWCFFFHSFSLPLQFLIDIIWYVCCRIRGSSVCTHTCTSSKWNEEKLNENVRKKNQFAWDSQTGNARKKNMSRVLNTRWQPNKINGVLPLYTHTYRSGTLWPVHWWYPLNMRTTQKPCTIHSHIHRDREWERERERIFCEIEIHEYAKQNCNH